MKKTILITLIISWSIFYAFGQNSMLSLSGHVMDVATGAPVPGHLVTAEIIAGGAVLPYDFLTDFSGFYGDTIPVFSQGNIHVFTYDCNGEIHEYNDSFFPGNYVFNFDFFICSDTTGTGCQAYFTYETVPGAQHVIQFFNNSTGSFTELLWEFGDGTTSTEPDPLHFYNAPGTYTVCLNIWDNTGNCQDVYCEDVNTGNVPGDCENWFIYETPNHVDFTFQGESLPMPADEWIWDFGDGNTGYGPL
ncbi:MAG: PKD domain-containing protein, partial [Bacteroidales bacterium]|nr:PKD domain-containing protein [Bacteroidales bacterium]